MCDTYSGREYLWARHWLCSAYFWSLSWHTYFGRNTWLSNYKLGDQYLKQVHGFPISKPKVPNHEIILGSGNDQWMWRLDFYTREGQHIKEKGLTVGGTAHITCWLRNNENIWDCQPPLRDINWYIWPCWISLQFWWTIVLRTYAPVSRRKVLDLEMSLQIYSITGFGEIGNPLNIS